jgi:RNA polymerase sigma-70 factor (ECF subfamily)
MTDNTLHKTKKINANNWVNQHGDYLYNYAYSRVQSKETAEDLVQETFISALKSIKSFRGDSSELTWLIAILKRKVIDYYRKSGRNKEIPASHFSKPFQEDGVYDGHWILDRAPKNWDLNFNDPLLESEFQQIMENCLATLPDKWKSVFVLKVLEEIKSDEVCKEVGCTPSNLWVIIHRARLQLRECIENNWLK